MTVDVMVDHSVVRKVLLRVAWWVAQTVALMVDS